MITVSYNRILRVIVANVNITWWNKKSYCWKSSNFPWIRPVPFWIENLCEGMWCHFQWINFWIHSAFLYVSDFLSDANEGITKTIKFGFGLRFGWFYVWKWRYLGSIRYIKLVKSIHFVNSSAQFWQLMSALASLEMFGEEDLVFINWRLCRHCLQNE